MHQHIADNDLQVIDARSAGRFSGKDPEPRANLSSGHMPNSFNMPFNKLADANGCLLDKATIKALFADSNLDLDKPIVTTCGSGVTAANLCFALDYIGIKDVTLYDGSWTEYAAHADSIIIKDVD
ncbi:MAG: hypothetical protein HRU28_15160 [Rhizobiales bacterium]|nr:hypothetical protein [Hyphomicrobiales bacterium]